MGHTPGPWKAHKRTKPIGMAEWEIHYSDDGECVAEVVHEEADAHLIAAAPEMYEALKNWLDVFSRFSPGHELRVLAIEEAQKVLAKAEGKKISRG